MNKQDAKLIAKTITFAQLKAMFDKAQVEVKDWNEISTVADAMTRDEVWYNLRPCVDDLNILARLIKLHPHVVFYSIWEFGDYLGESLKPSKKVGKSCEIGVYHEEPLFG